MNKPQSLRDKEQWGPIDAKLLYLSFWYAALVSKAGEEWGAYWPTCIGIFSGDRVTYLWEKGDAVRGGRSVIVSLLLVPSKKEKLWNSYQDFQKKMQDLADQIRGQIDEGIAFEKLRPLALAWASLLEDAWTIGVVPELANFAAPSYLEEQLKAYVPESERQNALETLLAPEALSFHQQSEKELLELAVRFSGKALFAELEGYAERWHWVENSYFASKRLTAQDFFHRVQEMSPQDIAAKVSRIETYLETMQEKKQKMCERYHLPPSVRELARILSHSIWWQDLRKGLSWWAHDTLDALSRVASQELHVIFDDIMYYQVEEWKAMFEHRQLVPADRIAARAALSIFVISPDGVQEFVGKEAQELRAFYLPEQTETPATTITEFQGIKVSSGAVTGMVRILLSPQHLDQMKPGEVLVAPMTSPDYILAMRMASAIVTDVGGLMSHAAIVARELGVPCIVGTKIATKVLKDGDLVEVDAERGMVRIIKKNKS